MSFEIAYDISFLFSYGLMGLGLAISIIMLGHLLCVHRSPGDTLAWSLVVILFPFLGAPLYLILGRRKLTSVAQNHVMAFKSLKSHQLETPLPPSSVHVIDHLLQAHSVPPATHGNSFRILRSGSTGREALFDLIASARYEILVAVYVLVPDRVGKTFIDHLAERARSGLNIYVLLDDVGAFNIGKRHLRPLLEAGGKVARFSPLLKYPWHGQLSELHLRNHRKFVVADGVRAWSGGMNIADCYLHDDPPPWRDLGFYIEGPAARLMRQLFLSNWQLVRGQKKDPILFKNDLLPPLPGYEGDNTVQILPSGPDISTDPLHAALLAASYTACERLWIMSPFFIPDDSLMTAWKMALQRGVDFRVYIGQKTSLLMDWARGSYLKEIQAAGGRILFIKAPRLHAKAVIADRNIAMLGSANMDYRSLFLNYELTAVIYTPPVIETIAEEMVYIAEAAEENTNIRTGLICDVISRITRIIAPLL